MFGECGRRAIPTAFGLSALLVVVTKIEAQPAPYYAALLATPESQRCRSAGRQTPRSGKPSSDEQNKNSSVSYAPDNQFRNDLFQVTTRWSERHRSEVGCW